MLIVVRHGRTAANAAGELLGRRDPGLDDLGRRQAEAIGAAVESPSRVVTSPLRRCRETAAAWGLPVAVDERLIEIDYGKLEGAKLADVPASTWAAWQADPAWRPPAGETLEELTARVSEALADLADEAESSDVVVVSHVSPIKAAVSWALGVGAEISWRCFVAQASITRVATRGGRPSLHAFNDISHLADID